MSTEVHFRDEVRKLEPEHPFEEELKGGEGIRYDADLQAGQYVHLVADQRGIDVTLVLRAPDGTELLKVDSPTGDTGPEHVFRIPEVSGVFRVEVFSTDASALAGHYEVKLDTPRVATDTDRKHVGAFKLFAEGDHLFMQGSTEDKKQALLIYEEALALWRELSDQEWVAESLFRIGWARHDLSERDKALVALQEALPLLQDLGKRVEEAMVQTMRGAIELRNGRVVEAKELHTQAVAIFHEVGKLGLEASALNNLGADYDMAGESQRGLDSYRLALQRAEAAKDVPHEKASAFRGIGEILIQQGKLEDAMDSLKQALKGFQELANQNQAAYVLTRMAGISQRLDRLDDAETQLQEALSMQEKAGDSIGEVVTLNSLGTVLLSKKEMPQTVEIYSRALTLARSTGNVYGEAVSLLNLGRYYYDSKNPQEALKLHEQSAPLFHKLGFRRGEVSTLYGSARALHALGDYAGALNRLEQVVDGVESLRAETTSESLRSAYFATKQHYLDLHIDVLMHLHDQNPAAGWNARALIVNERRRARSLLEILSEPNTNSGQKEAPEHHIQGRPFKERIDASVAALLAAQRAGRDDKIAEIEERQRALLLELAESDSRHAQATAVVHPKSLTIAEMQKLLGSWGLLLAYSLGEERSFVWCLTGDGKLSSHSLASRESLESMADQVHRAWSHRGSENESGARWAARLSREILGKVAEELGDKRLLVVADGALQTLPFAALPDPRHLEGIPESGEPVDPLVVRNEVVNLPSMSTLAALRESAHLRAAPPPSWVAIVADPVFDLDDPRIRQANPAPPSTANPNLSRAAEDLGIERFERLYFTRVEAEAISKLFPQPPDAKRLVLDFEASRDFVESQEVKRFRILHFATHGVLNSKHPELSGLVLSQVDSHGNPRADGFLLAHEISNLELPTQLVVLSACQTGLGGEVRGEGLVGLTRSFLSAGVPRVVVSLWNVNDQATAELMTRFYRNMVQKALPPSAALRCAQISMRGEQQWASPYFWAPFIFQGEWWTQRKTGPPPIGKQALPSQPPPAPDVDFPPPGSDGEPACPGLPGLDENGGDA